MRNLKKKVSEKRYLAVLLVLAAATTTTMVGFPQAFSTNYWSGWWWSNISHPDEFKNINGNWRVPYHLLETQVNALPWAAGDPATEARNAIVSGGNAWNGISTAWGLTNDETTSFYWDHSIGTENLGSEALAHTHWVVHLDNHLVDNDVHINNDGTNVAWDYLNEDQFTTPRTYDLRKVIIHEFGHWAFLCDTYPGNTPRGNCNGDIVDNSVMDGYEFGTAGTSLYAHDEDSIVGIYGG